MAKKNEKLKNVDLKSETKKTDIIVCIVVAFMLLFVYFVLCKCKEYYQTVAGNHYLELYEEIVDHTISTNKDLFDNSEYVAFDYNSFKIYGTGEQEQMLDYLQGYYDYIILGSLNVLEDNSFIDDKGDIKGLLIRAQEIKFEGKNVYCDFEVYKGIEDSLNDPLTYKVEAKYNNGKWKIHYTKEMLNKVGN